MLNYSKILKNLFKKKVENPVGLKDAFELGLITEEEFLRLKFHRAEEDLDEFLKAKKLKK